MPRIVPSQVVALIDQMFPWASTQTEGDVDKYQVFSGNSPQLAGVITLIEQIPSELLTLDGQSYGELIVSVAAIRDSLESWKHRDFGVNRVPGLPRLNPITLIRRALAMCPDEYPLSGTNDLNFITDDALRMSFRIDLSSVNRALSNGEWKAATVLAGSVLEALLLWRLQQCPRPDISTGVSKLTANQTLQKKPEADLASWSLFEYIEVTSELKLISEETAIQARLAKDFRNLIHPGRGIRLGQACNRGTALSAVAAMEHAIQDLTP